MKPNNLISFLSVVTVLGCFVPMARSEDVQTVDSPFETSMVTESCVLKITWEEEFSSLSPEVIEALLQSSGVWGAALNSTFGEKLPRVRESVEVQLDPLNLSAIEHVNQTLIRTLVARLSVRISGDAVEIINANARPLLNQVCEQLGKSIIEFGESTIMSRHEMRQRYTEELDRARKELHRILTERRAFLKKAESVVLDDEYLNHELHVLHEKKAELEMERTVSQARRDAMQEQIARLSEKARAEPIRRDDVEQLRRILEIREESLQHGKDLQEKGLTGPGDLNALKIEVAQAAAELARANADAEREHAARMHEMGGGFIVEMNHELTRMAIEEADTEAKYKTVLERIEKVRQSLKIAEDYEQIGGDRLAIARNRLETVQRGLAKIDQHISTSRRPTMTIIGAGQL